MWRTEAHRGNESKRLEQGWRRESKSQGGPAMGLFHLKRRQPLPAQSKRSAPPTPVSAQPGTRRRGGRRAAADGKIRAPGCGPSVRDSERSTGSEMGPRATAKAAGSRTAGSSRVGARGTNWIRDRPGGWQHGLYEVVTSLVPGA